MRAQLLIASALGLALAACQSDGTGSTSMSTGSSASASATAPIDGPAAAPNPASIQTTPGATGATIGTSGVGAAANGRTTGAVP